MININIAAGGAPQEKAIKVQKQPDLQKNLKVAQGKSDKSKKQIEKEAKFNKTLCLGGIS